MRLIYDIIIIFSTERQEIVMIYPQPKKIIQKDGVYKFKSQLPTNDLKSFYESSKKSPEITFKKTPSPCKEKYLLEISPSGISIAASSDEGFFRATTSLYQMIKTEGDTLNCVTVEDEPDFERRGYMLDISRCRMPKPETIKALIDNLALLKYNEFQLYIESFCFKYSLIPNVTEGFECLTPEDIEDIEKYCNDRFIDLVPNQNCLGHMGEWLKRDEYKHLEVGASIESTGTINPLLKESRELIDKIFDSLLPHFKSEYVNIGLDEAYGLGKYELEKICNERGTDGFFMDYLNTMNDRIGKKYGKKMQFWADMIINHPESFKRIPKGAVALEWGYELIQSQLMAEHCLALSEKGVEFYVCPSCNTHFTLTGRFDVTSFNLRTAGEVGRKYGAKGYLITDWGCGGEGHPHFGIWSFLPAALGGQYAWNVGAEQNGETFKAEYIRGAKAYTDKFIFNGANVSEYLYRISNYYLLEPERIHLGTMCGETLQYPLEKTGYYIFFDLNECGDDFYFDNVIRYITDILSDVKKLDMDTQYKREIFVNSKSVILSAHLCKIRKNKTIDSATAKSLIRLIDEIYGEYKELWLMRNYEKGVECFLKILTDRKEEIKLFINE